MGIYFFKSVVLLQRELDTFLLEPIMPITSQSSLDRSGERSHRATAVHETPCNGGLLTRLFPNLASVVRMLLAVPATSVSSERLFFKAGAIISDRRSRLTPHHAEQLCFLSAN